MALSNRDQLIIERLQRGEISVSYTLGLLTRGIPEENSKGRPEFPRKSLEELNSLVGLKPVKELIRDYLAFLEIQRLRQLHNLREQTSVMHMVFKGNPGTGKTTVARIIGHIFREIDCLEQGHLVECERSDLVGEYIGHTAQKTKKKIREALGGILFIDEAYALARGGGRDFGREAIDTLVKAMEDHRQQLVLILAGYRNEMERFIQTNPGLSSRLALQLDFPDYTIDQLVRIAEIMYQKREYRLSEAGRHFIYRVLTHMVNQEGLIRGNARSVRNLVEQSLRNQARRLSSRESIDKHDLMTITRADLERGIDL